MIEDQRFADNPSRIQNREALGEILASVFSRLSRAGAIRRLEASALAWSSVSSVEDLAVHPALSRMQLDVPGGTFDAVASPVRRQIKGGPVPALGQQTETIHRELAKAQA